MFNIRTRFGDDDGAPGAGTDRIAFPSDYHRVFIEDFLDALDEDRDPAIPGESALDAHCLIDAILLSSDRGKTVRLP